VRPPGILGIIEDSMSGAAAVTFLGHATVLLELAGRRILTDPVLSDRLLHLRRHSSPVKAELEPLDCVLISHLHQDHLHLASLRRLSADASAIVPTGGRGLVERAGFTDIREVGIGDVVELGEMRIEAVPATHPGRRPPLGPSAEAVGYVLAVGPRRIYFAGDTDLFDEMGELGDLDLALLPVWGWGTSIGEGHLDPARAVEALGMLRPRMAIPIHWGTFRPLWARRHSWLRDPPREFARLAAEAAPEVTVRVLEPGQSTSLP
jgi:L-ascorbate metabolism protein UlaG (beta-lactamase superfamily)